MPATQDFRQPISVLLRSKQDINLRYAFPNSSTPQIPKLRVLVWVGREFLCQMDHPTLRVSLAYPPASPVPWYWFVTQGTDQYRQLVRMYECHIDQMAVPQ